MGERKTLSPTLRNQLVVDFVPLVEGIARGFSRIVPANVAYDDLVSIGVIGLMDAIEKFDPINGASFKTYAQYRIQGAIRDELRNEDILSRGQRERLRKIDAARQLIQSRTGRDAMSEEIAQFLGLPIDVYNKIRSYSPGSNVLYLDEYTLDQNGNAGTRRLDQMEAPSRSDALELILEKEMRETVMQNLSKLPDGQAKMIRLIYFEGLTLAKIASLSGFTESRACQIHKQAITRLLEVCRMSKSSENTSEGKEESYDEDDVA